jgi:predicted ATP-dependent endonuclease of OLD family
MKIQGLSINNFRSIKQLNIKLPDICAFVGPNNCPDFPTP